jgi:hypothetical protein
VVAVRIAEDRRGRVPFALVGVVLLVGAAALVAVPAREPRTDPAVDRAVREATAASNGALRSAIGDAARAAARDPVVEPAATPAGRLLGNRTAFEDALRLRIYLAARDRFAAVRARAGGVRATPWLPPVRNVSDLRAAMERVHVARAGPNGTALRVRVENVTVRASRDGRRVGVRRFDANLTVGSPVLALHDRVERFDRRLDAGPLSAGLGRRLTARLYPVAWTRGWAQYAGAPVANVLGNRHVELAANGGALALQRATLGASDPGGERAHHWAAARVATTDLLAGVGLEGRHGSRRTARLLRAAEGELRTGSVPGLDRPAGASPEATVRVQVGSSADRALADVFRNRTADNLTRSVYTAGFDVIAGVERRRTERPPVPSREGWTYAGRTSEVERTVEDGSARLRVSVPEGSRVVERFTRRVRETRTVRYRWRRGEEVTATTRTVTNEYAVRLVVVATPAPNAPGPNRPVASAFEPGGPLDGSNLAGTRNEWSGAVDARGGVDALARRAVAGELDGEPALVPGSRPAGLREWLSPSVMRLHERVRELSVTVERGAAGTFETNPAARLAERLRTRRAELVGAPARYPDLASRARYAVRAAYLDRVIADLERRAGAARRERSAVSDRLRAAGVGSLERVRRVMRARDDEHPTEGLARDGLGGPLGLSVDTAPAYLAITLVDRDRLDARGTGSLTPLDARNRNLFTVPSADAVDTVLELFDGPATVRLGTAARALRSARGAELNETARRRRAALRSAVRAGNRRVATALRRELADRGVPESTRNGLVNGVLGRYRRPAVRTLALANGSVAAALAVGGADGPAERERLEAALRTRTERALGETRVPQRLVNDTTTAVRSRARQVAREHARRALANATDRAAERARGRAGERLAAVPAGLPVLPVPSLGGWYATVNVWQVRTRGGYERVTVRSRRGPRDTVYTRDGTTVGLDWNGDGERERLGNASRVRFDVSTVVVVVVPPGGRGVGDTDGNADERSPGWRP